MTTRLSWPAVALVAGLVAACAAGGGQSPPTQPSAAPTASVPAPTASVPASTPTPIAPDVASPADAAALVIATDPRFEGAIALSPDVIGASKWWEALALDDGAYRISLTVGWGDCPAGCINHHTWVFRVSADGEVALLEELGDPVSEGSFPGG